jgi:hypothetical protein
MIRREIEESFQRSLTAMHRLGYRKSQKSTGNKSSVLANRVKLEKTSKSSLTDGKRHNMPGKQSPGVGKSSKTLQV